MFSFERIYWKRCFYLRINFLTVSKFFKSSSGDFFRGFEDYRNIGKNFMINEIFEPHDAYFPLPDMFMSVKT